MNRNILEMDSSIDTSNQDLLDLRKCFVGYNQSIEERQVSSSGGIFILIAKYVLLQGGVVFGAAYDDNHLVYHRKAENIDQLDALVGSKYMQSRMGNCFAEIKDHLESEKTVLFVGTACQISGLKSFLRRNYKKLITVDFICLGVPSPLVWKDYIETFFQKDSIVDINFKNKDRGWHTFSLYIKSEDKVFSEDGKKNYFFCGYFEGLYSRPCCSECFAKQGQIRVSDITLSDSWGCEKFAPEMDDNKGLSDIIIHSKSGLDVFKEISKNLVYKEVSFNDLIEGNRGYFDSKPKGQKRSQFWSDYQKLEKEKVFKKYCSSTYGIRIIYRKIKQILKNILVRNRK